MASGNVSDLCSVCNKLPGKYFCKGCQKHICSKDLKLHEQKLLEDFDNEIVSLHNRVLEESQKLVNPINTSSSVLFDQIERWKTRTIKYVEKAAEDARNTLTRFINKHRLEIQEQTKSLTDEIRRRRDEEDVLETDIERLKSKITNIQRLIHNLHQGKDTMTVVVENDQIDWKQMIYILEDQPGIPNLPVNAQWEQEGVTVAGGHGAGGNNNQLNGPWGFFVDDDDDRTIVIADHYNHRIMQWKIGDTKGQVVAGGNGQGGRLDQLHAPIDVLIDKVTNSLIIADSQNGRVIRWSRRSGTIQGEILISNIMCSGIVLDQQRHLYVSDYEKDEVRRYEIDRGDKKGTLVAGGNGKGSGLNQFNYPTYLFVDRNQSLYVSDFSNHRVMKWDRGAAQGVVAAGGEGEGSALTQLWHPNGIFVDILGILYVAELQNNRVTRWPQAFERKGTVVVDGNVRSPGANQLSKPDGLSFDKYGNLYVADNQNHHVQRFNLIK